MLEKKASFLEAGGSFLVLEHCQSGLLIIRFLKKCVLVCTCFLAQGRVEKRIVQMFYLISLPLCGFASKIIYQIQRSLIQVKSNAVNSVAEIYGQLMHYSNLNYLFMNTTQNHQKASSFFLYDA